MRLKLKKTITAQEADALINKYYDGTTTNTEEERLRRVMTRDAIDRATALRWIALQMPEDEKQKMADVLLINDGRAPILPQLIQHQLIPPAHAE